MKTGGVITAARPTVHRLHREPGGHRPEDPAWVKACCAAGKPDAIAP